MSDSLQDRERVRKRLELCCRAGGPGGKEGNETRQPGVHQNDGAGYVPVLLSLWRRQVCRWQVGTLFALAGRLDPFLPLACQKFDATGTGYGGRIFPAVKAFSTQEVSVELLKAVPPLKTLFVQK